MTHHARELKKLESQVANSSLEEAVKRTSCEDTENMGRNEDNFKTRRSQPALGETSISKSGTTGRSLLTL